jgi:protein MpaA
MIITEWKTIQKSVKNQNIDAAFIGTGTKSILFIACMHGDEQLGKSIALRTLAYFEENKLLLKDKLLVMIPVLNPDGYIANTRTNANEVDINRNFPTENWELSKDKDEFYSGVKPGSEPETQIIMDLIKTYKPVLILTLHQPYRVVNFDGPAQKYAELMSRLNKYPIEEDIGYPTPGSLGTYAGKEMNIPVITLELPDNESDETVWKDNHLAIIAAINHS